MQTQGISLITSGQRSSSVSHTTKANDTTFDSFMSNHAQKAKVQERTDAVSVSESRPADKDYIKVSANSVSKNTPGTAKETISGQSGDFGNDKPAVEEVDVNAFAEQMRQMLAQMFGMTEEEITDILEQSGIDTASLLFQVQPDDTVLLVNQEALQQLVMDIHGIEDKSAFLTSDVLNSELLGLTEMVKELGAEILGVETGQLDTLEDSLMLSFAEQFAAGTQDGNTQGTVSESMAIVVPQENEADIAGGEMESDASDGMQVIVENYKHAANDGSQMESGAGNSQPDETMENSDTLLQHAGRENPDKTTAAGLFTERLSQAFGEIAEEAVSGPETVMTHIVEQVVRQVRIRVLPQTTSMELQLNPESLGKVNLHVSSTGGAATATLVVENQVAKEALESQMITLKQSFEEQGLKVDAVEVTVSEFGLKQDGGQTDNGQENPAGKRSFRENAGTEGMEEVPEDTAQTAEERRDINSVIDYTA